MIRRNFNPAGRTGCIVLGLAQILDGVVRVASGGFFQTTAPLAVLRKQTRLHIHIQNLERARDSEAAPDDLKGRHS